MSETDPAGWPPWVPEPVPPRPQREEAPEEDKGPYTAEIDHDRLATADAGAAGAWFDTLVTAGLATIDPEDPRVPGALRDLLTIYRPAPKPLLHRLGVTLGLLVGGLPAVALWPEMTGTAVFLGVLTPLLAVFGGMCGRLADAALRQARFLPRLTTPIARRDHAVERLRSEPFVVKLGETFVVNAPAGAWLTAQVRLLDEAVTRCEERIRDVDHLSARLLELTRELGETRPDPQHEELLAVRSDEESLLARIRGLREAVGARQERLAASLARARTAAELAVVRHRTATLLGGARRDELARLDAELEVELADLRADAGALDRDIAAEQERWRAVAEVSALSRRAVLAGDGPRR